MNKYLIILILSLFSFLSYAQTADQQLTIVKSHVTRIDTTIDWIYATDAARRPSNSLGWFFGDRVFFYNWAATPTNGADRSFGYFLYYTYDMYCALKNLAPNCLGAKLRVDYSINGSDKYLAKTFFIKTPIGSFTTQYFQEVRYILFKHLETLGGLVPQNVAVENELNKGRHQAASVDLYVTTDVNGNGNDQWRDGDYLQSVVLKAKTLLGQTAGFKYVKREVLKNTAQFQSQDQYPLLRDFSYLRGNNKIVSLISGYNTTTTAGLSWVGRTMQPVFVMRSRYNYPFFATQGLTTNYKTDVAIDSTARVFLHELGHNMGLDHCTAINQSSLCTDNFWLSDAGRQFTASYLNTIAALKVAYEY